MSNTDTSAADNDQLAAIFAVLRSPERIERAKAIDALARKAAEGQTGLMAVKAYRTEEMRLQMADSLARTEGRPLPELPPLVPEQGDPQWAGPSLPHPSEATSDEEHADLQEGWDNWAKGIDPNQIHEGHYDEAGI